MNASTINGTVITMLAFRASLCTRLGGLGCHGTSLPPTTQLAQSMKR